MSKDCQADDRRTPRTAKSIAPQKEYLMAYENPSIWLAEVMSIESKKQ